MQSGIRDEAELPSGDCHRSGPSPGPQRSAAGSPSGLTAYSRLGLLIGEAMFI